MLYLPKVLNLANAEGIELGEFDEKMKAIAEK
jgi:hypothetical protein